MMDRFIGIRAGAILFSFFIMAGQLLFAAGAYVNHFWLVGLGRFVFAIGGESLAVSLQSAWRLFDSYSVKNISR